VDGLHFAPEVPLLTRARWGWSEATVPSLLLRRGDLMHKCQNNKNWVKRQKSETAIYQPSPQTVLLSATPQKGAQFFKTETNT
jgi:hypothetical protein